MSRAEHKIKKILLFTVILSGVLVFPSQGVFAPLAYNQAQADFGVASVDIDWIVDPAGDYYSSGTVVSTNLLAGLTINNIDYFGYNCSIPANTSLQVMFSQDGSTWYSASHVADTYTDLADGSHLTSGAGAIALSGFSSEYNFYYKVLLANTDSGASTPTLIQADIIYNTGSYATTTTQSASSVTGLTATGNGNITNAGSSAVTKRGFQYGISQTSGLLEVSETGSFATGAYTLSLTNLYANTLYNIRSFVQNTEGRAYGDWQTFTTNYYYYSSGTVVSTNLLTGLSNVGRISGLPITATVPAGASATAQFSQDAETWVAADGTGGTTAIADGTNTIDLSGLAWIGANFYYKIVISANTGYSATPTLTSVGVNYDPPDAYWVGGTGNWSDAANHWACSSGGTASASCAPGATTNVHFDNSSCSSACTVTIDSASVTVANFDESDATDTTIATSTNGITVTGDSTINKTVSGATAITFSGTGKTITGGSGGTISSPVILSATQTVAVATGTFTMSGIISDGGAAKGLSKTGANTLTLSGANTFTGGLTIKAGTVTLSTSVNAAGTGTITIGDTSGTADAILKNGYTDFNSGNPIANPITVASGSSGTMSITTTNDYNLTLSGAVTLNNNLLLNTSAGLMSIFTLTGGVTGTGNVTISNNNATTIIISTSSLNHIGTITNSGSGTGGTAISAVIGANVTGVIQNNATSQLALSGNNSAYAGGVTIKAGMVKLSTSANAAGTGTVTIGDTSGSADAKLYMQWDTTFANPITVASGSSGTLSIIGLNNYNVIIGGAVMLNNNLTLESGSGSFSSYFILTGGVTGTGNIITKNNSSNTLTISTGSVNNIGTITNSGTGTGTTTISAVIGAAVTGIIQNSATSALTLSGNNSTVGDIDIQAGTLTLAADKNLNVSDDWSNAGTFTASSGSTVTFTTGTHTLTGANTFYNLTLNASNTVTFPASTTQTISNTFSCAGTLGNLITINSSSVGTKATLSKASGTVSCDYMSITDSLAIGGAEWHAGVNSTGSNYDGWLDLNSAPILASGPSDNSSSSTTPTNVGSSVLFSASATDTQSEDYYLAVCKTNSITANNGTAPTCATNQTLCVSSATASGSSAVCSYTTSVGDVESNAWYAFVCDGNSSYALCSSSNQGSGDSGSPFNVNHIPVFTAISTSPDLAGLGQSITFSSTASDSDTDTSADTVTLYICKSNDFTGTACGAAGEWCHSSASASNPTCAYTVGSTDISGTKTYYGYIIDSHNFQSASNPRSSSFGSDINPPVISNLSPAAGAISGLPTSVSFTLNEIGYCRSSLSNLSYSAMTSADDCTGGGTTSITCSVSTTNPHTLNTNISCQDAVGNENTTSNGNHFSYNLPGGGPGGAGLFSPIIETTQEVVEKVVEQIIEIPQKITEQVENIGKGIGKAIDVLKPDLKDKQIVFPPIEESVSKETPLVFKNSQNIFSPSELGNFVLTPLPKDVQSLVSKFPNLKNTFEKLGISKMANLQEMRAASFNLPTLNETLPQLSQGIALSEISQAQKSKVPTDIVFASMAEEKIGLNIKVFITDQGQAIQTISTIQNQMVTFSVKPEYEAETVKGYVIFKGKNDPVAKKDSFIAGLSSMITQPQTLVLDVFDYTDIDKDGIYTASIVSPAVDANYEVRTIIDYKNRTILSKELSMIMLVDPEGYVYRKISDSEESRIKGAIISIYWLNPETKQYEIWPAKDFQQTNPQITDATGKYSFLVPEGFYYLKVEHILYAQWQSDPFEVQQGSGVHTNIELKSKNWLLSIFDPGSLLVALSLLLLSVVMLVSAVLISSSIQKRKLQKEQI